MSRVAAARRSKRKAPDRRGPKKGTFSRLLLTMALRPQGVTVKELLAISPGAGDSKDRVNTAIDRLERDLGYAIYSNRNNPTTYHLVGRRIGMWRYWDFLGRHALKKEPAVSRIIEAIHRRAEQHACQEQIMRVEVGP